MPEVNETNDNANNANEAQGNNEGTQQPQQGTMSRIMAHVSGNKVEAALWATRLFTLGCVFNYIIPIWTNAANAYHKALLCNAATSALRLHQRVPQMQLSREFLGRLFLEDSAHYLFYSVIFLTSNSIMMVLVPIFLFALLHAQNYTKQLLNIIGPNSVMLIRNLMAKIEPHQVSILRFIAINEIFIMPATIMAIFTGSGSLLLPFMYYRFLSLRYSSQRNPYCRQCFYELRMTVETFICRPGIPLFLRNSCEKAIAFISRLAPQAVAAPPPQAQ